MPDNTRSGTDSAIPGTDSAIPGIDNARPGTDNRNIVPDNNTKKKKRRPKKKNKGKKDIKDQTNVKQDNGDQQNAQVHRGHASNSVKDGQRKKKKRSRRRRFDRYFGRFRCRKCRRTWDSAHVFTIAGTKKVVFKQRCKTCTTDDAWTGPFALELLKCSVCHSKVCECTCDECDKLIHLRYILIRRQDPKGEIEEREVDNHFEYCDCPDNKRRSKAWVGANIDLKKRHLAHLCQKCIKGFPCCRAASDENYNRDWAEAGDNEP